MKVQDKFEEKLKNIINIATERFGNDKNEHNLKDLIEHDIPFIYSFFKNPTIKQYIQPSCNFLFYTKISKPLQSLVNAAIFLTQK